MNKSVFASRLLIFSGGAAIFLSKVPTSLPVDRESDFSSTVRQTQIDRNSFEAYP
jgi:hypothetical protein